MCQSNNWHIGTLYFSLIHSSMKNYKNPLCYLLLWLLASFSLCAQSDYTAFVNRFIGSGKSGKVVPAAVVPFGMVQLGPNTAQTGSGYNYYDNTIAGFSHVNKSGGGCGDFQDVLFVPISENRWKFGRATYPKAGFATPFSHENEKAEPGYYQILLDGVQVELTATARCGFHRYRFPSSNINHLAIDLKHGSTGACTIVKEDDIDTVKTSAIRLIDPYTIEGYRISNGWAKEQQVYFYAKFSKPMLQKEGFFKSGQCALDSVISGTDIRAIFSFDGSASSELLVKVGISSVSCSGARLNLEAEIPNWDFDQKRLAAKELWNKELSKFDVQTTDLDQKTIFYSSLYNVLVYPMVSSDVTGNFRGPDLQIHQAEGFQYYGGVVGLWDTFRAALPLLSFVRPDISKEYILTFLEHYKYFGQLPIWTLAGNETFQMLGLHAVPVITDAYFKNIKGFDIEKAYDAMKVSLLKDTIGYSMRYFVGLKNYKKYGFVPADLEAEATARTLEYAYDDWCMARLAKGLGKKEDAAYFSKRALNYANVFDKEMGFMNGRKSDGNFRCPFNPFQTSHRKDDFCEGNAWQWSFFVPHDVEGLAALMGGKKGLATKLDSLFTISSKLEGENASGDITGLIGQYAHGNEPSHHIAYLYNRLGQAWKTQQYVNRILTTLYQNSPDGICGDEDTGQMSAWFVFSSMGFYPMNPANQEFEIGSPLFDALSFKTAKGTTFRITTENRSKQNIYIQSVSLNGIALKKTTIHYNDILQGGTLHFVMGNTPNKHWGK